MGRPTINLADAALAHPAERVALRFEGRAWTYGALADWVAAEAAGLAALGVGPGDRVAVLALNHPRTVVLLLACARVGAMLVPLNWRLARAELQWIVEDAAPVVLFVDGVVRGAERDGMRVVDLGAAPVFTPALSHQGKWAGDDTVLLVYTSGTTGRPKGAMLSGTALLANAALSWDMHGMTAADHVLTVLPLFHVGGLNVQTLPALLAGATVTLHARFDPGAVLAALRTDRPTLTVLVPATLQAVAGHPGWAEADLSSLRAVTTGSTVVQPAVVAPFVVRGGPGVAGVWQHGDGAGGDLHAAGMGVWRDEHGALRAGGPGHRGG